MVQSGWWPSIFGFSAPSRSLASPPSGNRRHARGLTRPRARYHYFRERWAGFVSARAWAHFWCVIILCSSPDGGLSIESISGENTLRRSDGKTERLLGIYSSVIREENHKGSFFFPAVLSVFCLFFSVCLFAFQCFYYFSFSLSCSFFFICSYSLSSFPVFFLPCPSSFLPLFPHAVLFSFFYLSCLLSSFFSLFFSYNTCLIFLVYVSASFLSAPHPLSELLLHVSPRSFLLIFYFPLYPFFSLFSPSPMPLFFRSQFHLSLFLSSPPLALRPLSLCPCPLPSRGQ